MRSKLPLIYFHVTYLIKRGIYRGKPAGVLPDVTQFVLKTIHVGRMIHPDLNENQQLSKWTLQGTY